MSFGEAWRKAGEEPDEFEPPTGTYQTVIVDGNAFTSRAGDDYAKVILQIDAGDFVGQRFQHFMGFKHEVGARINREALALYGVRPDEISSIEELDDAIAELVKRRVQAEVAVSYKNDYMQVKVLGSRTPGDSDIPSDPDPPPAPQTPPAATFAAAAGTAGDDDAPPF